ncbi:OLC1v1036181C2 [Oldenlandia corymbosa var. corymbosa]|uniref:OLC1v1036181C2 n=1 Tax=Oldenlandia corymbosa var. corymbosa TaxID=529605 RepID=A0AAV1CUR7_OLDCO|nr:OLC1v1036181C2 [Oldenlandia corymbosa var. corymbosa]
MANPPSRRTSSSISSPYSTTNYVLPISDNPQFQLQTPQLTNLTRLVNSAKFFLKKPHAFPFLLSIFLLLTWVSLRLQRLQHPKTNFQNLEMPLSGAVKDQDANLMRFPSTSPTFAKDNRGWLIDPVSVALEAGIRGGATICASVHVGEIKPQSLRGNHRHHFCNETFIIWGAKTLFRLQFWLHLRLEEDEYWLLRSIGF